MLDEDAIIERLMQHKPNRRIHPPLSHRQLQVAEARLGFELPPLLRRLYTEVSNGDFGLGLGVFPLTLPNDDLGHPNAPETVVSRYRGLRDTPVPPDFQHPRDKRPLGGWPEKLLMIVDWGCNIYSCVDCSIPSCPVLRNDNNRSHNNRSHNNRSHITLAVESAALERWFESWLSGERLFKLDWDTAEKVLLP